MTKIKFNTKVSMLMFYFLFIFSFINADFFLNAKLKVSVLAPEKSTVS